MKIGDMVKNKNDEEFIIEELLNFYTNTYPIVTRRVSDNSDYTYTKEGHYQEGKSSSNLCLQVNDLGDVITFGEYVEEYIEPVEEVVEEYIEPVEEVVEEYIEPVEEASFIAPPFKLEDIVYKGDNKITLNTGDTINIGMTPYEASLKATKLELLAELTGLVENNTAVKEIILKVKTLKKLLEI